MNKFSYANAFRGAIVFSITFFIMKDIFEVAGWVLYLIAKAITGG